MILALKIILAACLSIALFYALTFETDAQRRRRLDHERRRLLDNDEDERE